jgi:hypothetical protein
MAASLRAVVDLAQEIVFRKREGALMDQGAPTLPPEIGARSIIDRSVRNGNNRPHGKATRIRS